MQPGLKKFFTHQLLRWHDEENTRQLPWKNETDPYKIWLSEIILQQTRAEQGRPYYEKFITQYPTVTDLAAAPEVEVFRLWQGLGYYNRCRNMIAAARTIVNEYQGIFPSAYTDILALKGVGPYTAAAIASFAYGLPYAVLDGNVYRVLSRFFAIDTPVDSVAGKKEFQELASDLLDADKAAAFNQAIMDFGAEVCKPQLPVCDRCPFAEKCLAKKQDLIAVLPLKTKKISVKERHFHYFILTTDTEIYVQERTAKDIWHGLYEFFLIETAEDYRENKYWKLLESHVSKTENTDFTNRQRLTHQLITSSFHILHLHTKPVFLKQGLWLSKDSLKKIPFPKTILSFLNRKKYF